MDTKKDILTEHDIKELIDNLDKVVIPKEPSFTITASDDWLEDTQYNLNFGDLSTNQISIQPLSTAQLSPLLSSNLSNVFLTSATGQGAYTVGTNGIHSGWTTLSPTLEVKGKANFEDDIIIKGKSLTESLDAIEKRLAILKPNIEIESKWEELKQLGEKYRELEKQIIEQEAMFNTLKK